MSVIIMFCHRLLITLILTCLTYLVFGAHFHTHAKERVEDSFNSLHYDEHGKHYSDYDHQAILGSKKAAEEYGELSPEESKQRLRILVTKGGMDKNNDGYVDKSELFEWVSNSFKSLALEEGGERLAEEDMDNDGKVSWTEHINSNFDAENNFEDEEEMIHEDKELWKAADQDGDNLLDVKEFTAFYSPEEHDRMHDALYELTMQRKDKNKDGFLDFNEFISDDHGSIPDTKTETYVLEKEKFQTDYDLNHDQRLDKGEVLRWIIPDMNQSVEQEVDHLIETCDDDNDGRLSVDEIVSHYTTFVSSEATNFGDNLYETEHDEL